MGSNRRGRVLVCLRRIAFGDGVGGMERAAADHIKQLLHLGYEVEILTPIKFMSGVAPEGVTVIDVPWPRWNSGTGFPTFGFAYSLWVRNLCVVLRRVLEPGNIVHLHGGSAGVLRSRWKRSFMDVATVVNPHGMEEFGPFSVLRAPNRFFLRRLVRGARRADAVIATDMSLIDVVRRNVGVQEEKIFCIPNAVDVARMQGFRKDLSGSGFTIVSVGRLVHNKGYDLLLHALRKQDVRSALPDGWRWIHFGSGPEADNLRSSATAAPSIPLTIMEGQSDEDVQSGIAACNIFVQPSRYEGSSLTTLEAMSHGVPIVATPVGGIPDKVIDGLTGYLSERVSDEAIGIAIRRCVESPEDVGAAAKKLVEREFSLEACGRKYAELYSEIVLSRS